jgi:hypothetical protein
MCRRMTTQRGESSSRALRNLADARCKSLYMMPATEHNDSKRRCPLAMPTAPLHGQPPLPISPNACLIKPAAAYVFPWAQKDIAASGRCAMSPCLIGMVSYASASLSYACLHTLAACLPTVASPSRSTKQRNRVVHQATQMEQRVASLRRGHRRPHQQRLLQAAVAAASRRRLHPKLAPTPLYYKKSESCNILSTKWLRGQWWWQFMKVMSICSVCVSGGSC